MRIYLDSCCYNRPYDDQTQIRINLETQAKLYIQDLIRKHEVDLVTSYILEYENTRNRREMQREAIRRFIDDNGSIRVSERWIPEAEKIASEIQATGIKEKDSLHLACALLAQCDYFISTDDRLLKYKTDHMQLVTPTEFIQVWEVRNDG